MAVAVLTRSYDNTRSGANTQEAGLHPDVVARGLHMLFNLQLARATTRDWKPNR